MLLLKNNDLLGTGSCTQSAALAALGNNCHLFHTPFAPFRLINSYGLIRNPEVGIRDRDLSASIPHSELSSAPDGLHIYLCGEYVLLIGKRGDILGIYGIDNGKPR